MGSRELLAGVLEYIALRTDLLCRTANEQFVVTRNNSRFLIDLYTGAPWAAFIKL